MNKDNLTQKLTDIDAIGDVRGRADGRLEADLTDSDTLYDTVETIREMGITHLITISGVDAGEHIDVLYHFLKYGELSDGDLTAGLRLTLRVTVPTEDPTVDSITDLIPAAGLYEREIMDMLGIDVEGHPNPKRLLLADDYEGGPPLRAENIDREVS